MTETAQMRFRTDGPHLAELSARLRDGRPANDCVCEDPACIWKRANYGKVPPAEPGDTWELRWHRDPGEPEGPVAGYAICCPRCKDIHYWTSANNCSSKRVTESGSVVCDHTGKGSCWTWTGDPRENKMTGRASLFANGEGLCGWHGFLTDGVLK